MDPLVLLLIGMAIVVGGILVFRAHAFLALIIGALVVAALTSTASLERYAEQKGLSQDATQELVDQTFGERVARGFGATCAKIGILIAMAAIIGACLLSSGAADRIVRSALALFGERRAPVAFLSSGFLLGIPVFFDTVFYLMVPLCRAMALRTGRNFLLYVLAVVAAATMAHTLVPPTPGPLFVAAELGVDIGLMMGFGLAVGMFTAGSGFLYARWANRRWQIPVRETADASAEQLAAVAARDERELPPLSVSLLPIVLPVVLIAGGTALALAVGTPEEATGGQRVLLAVFRNLGNSSVALTVAAVAALTTLAWRLRGDRDRIAETVQSALRGGGLIILITAAGGALGAVLQQTGIGPRIEELAAAHRLALLPLAFAVTSPMRTAQGSATVAMITSVGILAGFADPALLGFNPVYLALAIGCGSKPIPWMNDSGFWIVGKMSGFTEAETLKTFSVMLSVMGIVGLAVTMILARALPMV